MEDKILEIAEKLKLDEDKVFEALPAIAYIVEKSELIDYAQELGSMTSANGFKLMMRVVSRMKQYQNEVDEVLTLLFNVDAKTLSGSDKMKLLKKILTEKDVADFF